MSLSHMARRGSATISTSSLVALLLRCVNGRLAFPILRILSSLFSRRHVRTKIFAVAGLSLLSPHNPHACFEEYDGINVKSDHFIHISRWPTGPVLHIVRTGPSSARFGPPDRPRTTWPGQASAKDLTDFRLTRPAVQD